MANEAINRSLSRCAKARTQSGPRSCPTGGGKTKISLRVILRWLAETTARQRRALADSPHTPATPGAPWLQQLLAIRRGSRGGSAPLRRPGEVRRCFRELSDRDRAIRRADRACRRRRGSPRGRSLVRAPLYRSRRRPGFSSLQRRTALTICRSGSTRSPTRSPTASFRARCVIEPVFDPPARSVRPRLAVAEGVADLADYVLERAEQDFKKVFVAVSNRERLRSLRSDRRTARRPTPSSP